MTDSKSSGEHDWGGGMISKISIPCNLFINALKIGSDLWNEIENENYWKLLFPSPGILALFAAGERVLISDST